MAGEKKTEEAKTGTEDGEVPEEAEGTEPEAPEIEGAGPPAEDWLLVVFDDDQPWAFRVQTSGTLIPSHLYAVSGWLKTEAEEQQRRSKHLQDMMKQKEARLKDQDAKEMATLMADPDLKVRDGEAIPPIPAVKKSRRRKR